MPTLVHPHIAPPLEIEVPEDELLPGWIAAGWLLSDEETADPLTDPGEDDSPEGDS